MTVTARRVALVTGAGQRVGQAIAVALGRDGWHVAVHHRESDAGARDTAEQVRAAGSEATLVRADLADADAPALLVAEVMARCGRLDLLVNSAAGMQPTPLGSTTAAHFDAIIALNLRAPFLLAQAAAAVLPEGGAIVNIGDHMAEEPWPDFAVHGISKAGVRALTRHLAAALAPRIRVNAVAPGFVLKPAGMPDEAAERFASETPLRRLGTPDDVAEAVRFLADARYVTGEILHVDGGRRVRP